VHDFLEANGTAYLVMELLGGQTLQEQVKRQGPLDAERIDKILWPLLDGLEQVHSAGFLHRDIKPANILLDGQGRPTLIDFGASRAAIAGRSQAMTAVFTPGYAAVEQFTATAQGPWSDIYGLAATLHHAITGQAPPNAIDRILDDTYAPLADSNRPFPRELLAGIDAGLAVRAADRPQSIAAWRTALSQSPSAASAAPATVVMRSAPSAATTVTAPPRAASRKRPALMLAAGVAVICALAGGWFVLSPRPSAPPSSAQASVATVPAAPPVQDRAQEELEQARREQKAALEEAARLRTEAETRRKADEEAALRRKIEEEMRQKAEADEAARRHAAEEAKRQAEAQAAAQRQAEEKAKSKAEAEAAARLKAEEADLKGAEAVEAALRLTQPDRQRIQVALAALGFVTGGSDGVFGPRSREMISSWQKKSGRAATGYMSADTQTALLREAAPALARYDEEQKKLAETHQAPSQEQASSAKGSGQCEGIYSGEWCRGAFQGFPPSCWHVPMTVRNGAISGSWTSPGASEPQTFTGRINAGGEVQLTYNGIGQQTYTNQHFTVQMTGRMAEGIITAGGRAGSNGRDFTVRLQCR
jgi:peptidoglycan hydrolase-like protein with peptidoglycan-binding domain